MDGRHLRHVLWGLLTLACGCAHPLGFLRGDRNGDTMVHKAPTYEAYANFRAVAGFSAEHTPEQQAQFREEAKLAYQKAIAVDPKYLPSYVGLARLQVRCEDYTGAVATYQQALKLAPADASLWHECGLCQCRQKNWQDAIASMQKACELSPGNRPYQMALGYTLGRAGKLSESLATLTQVEGEAKAHFDLARLLRHMNQPELAKQQAVLAVQKDPSLPEAQQLLAELEGRGPAVIQTTANKEAAGAPPASSVVTAAMTVPAPAREVATTRPQPDAPPPAVVKPNQAGPREGTPIRIPPRPVIPAGAGK